MDDIDFLLKHSEKDSSLFVIDSSHRDRNKYPAPSEYILDFTQPFRYVFGFDIIDATIPSTMYSIDTHNNLFCLGILSSDNCHDTLARHVTECPDLMDIYNGHTAHSIHFVFCDRPPQVTNIDVSTVDNVFVVVGKNVMQVAQTTMDALIANNEYTFTLQSIRLEIEIGNYNINTLQVYLKKQLRPYGIDVRSTSTDIQVEKQMKYRFVHYNPSNGVSLPFFLDMVKSTCGTILGYDELPERGLVSNGYSRCTCFNRLNDRVFMTVKNNTDDVYQVISPGVVNLLGVRYVTLRCPEIESHLLGSLGYDSHNTGLGIFKLQSPFEVSNLKFDFFNFVKKPFHPIGKLTRLSLRFERDTGVLYNFRGINHQILVSIKYYVPCMNNVGPQMSVLNPNYDPDYIKFIVERDEILNDDEDDDSDYEVEDDSELLKKYVFMKNN